MTGPMLDRLQIAGYRSIEECDLRLGRVNVVVGSNGAGKSNLLSALGLLGSMVNRSLQQVVEQSGGPATLLRGGPKVTKRLRLHATFGQSAYEVVLARDARDHLTFKSEICFFSKPMVERSYQAIFGTRHLESGLGFATRLFPDDPSLYVNERILCAAMSSWQVFRAVVTGPDAGMKQYQRVGDNVVLRPDASNLAPFLYRLLEESPGHVQRIAAAVRLVDPVFDRLHLAADPLDPEQIRVEWKQPRKRSSAPLHALSDGTLRFLALSTLLLQPNPPTMVLMDEPELGLDPVALGILAAMVRDVSASRQVVLATQSPTLLDHVDPADLIVAEHRDGATTVHRPEQAALRSSIEERSLGQWWIQHLLDGAPGRDSTP
jgi:predicted ATPase